MVFSSALFKLSFLFLPPPPTVVYPLKGVSVSSRSLIEAAGRSVGPYSTFFLVSVPFFPCFFPSLLAWVWLYKPRTREFTAPLANHVFPSCISPTEIANGTKCINLKSNFLFVFFFAGNYLLAVFMQVNLRISVPKFLPGDWHLPYYRKVLAGKEGGKGRLEGRKNMFLMKVLKDFSSGLKTNGKKEGGDRSRLSLPNCTHARMHAWYPRK